MGGWVGGGSPCAGLSLGVPMERDWRSLIAELNRKGQKWVWYSKVDMNNFTKRHGPPLFRNSLYPPLCWISVSRLNKKASSVASKSHASVCM